MRSIGLKLWSGMMILVICMLALLWFAQIVFLEQFYTNMKIKEIKDRGYQIIRDINSVDKETMANSLEEFAYQNNLGIEVLDAGGNVLYNANASGVSGMGNQFGMGRNNVRAQAIRDVLSGQEAAIATSHPRFSGQIMFIGLPVKSNDKITGAFLITMPLAPVTETTAILKKQLTYISVILLAVSLLISFVISRTLTKPVREITRAAEGLAAGNYEGRIAVQGQDEIAKLAGTFNYMAAGLAKTEQLRKELIANVSHELRTPLSLIRGYAETIRDVSGDNEQKREKQVGIIIEETVRLSNIVDDILNLSQLESGYLLLKKEPFSLKRILEGIVKRYEILSEKTRVRIMLDNPGDFLTTADETRIEQVLYNLINNAFNHSFAEGTITVRALEKQDHVRVEVSDTGPGIAEVDIKYIWDRYYKASMTGTNRAVVAEATGSGLGLAIVRAILDAHGSEFGVESTIGMGTTFWFELEKTATGIS